MTNDQPPPAKDGPVDHTNVTRLGAWLVFLSVLVISLSFALYTNHAWEDFHIAYRSSQNFAAGRGLVYTQGDRIQAFTSPLVVLVLAALSYITGSAADVGGATPPGSPALVLWLFRGLSVAAVAGAAVLLYQIARSQSFKTLAVFVLIGLFATNVSIVDFSINGQETGFMMLFLTLAMHGLLVPGRTETARLAVAWAGLMWTRFDGFVFAGSLAAAFLVFNAGPMAGWSRRRLLGHYALAAVAAMVLYLPWPAWSWSYYGSPIPQTIIAKAIDARLDWSSVPKNTGEFLKSAMTAGVALQHCFAPIYFWFGGWPEAALRFCGVLGWLAAWYWVLPFGRRQARAVSLAFLLGSWYLNVVTRNNAPWYYPSITILAAYVIGQIVQQTSDFLDAVKSRAGGKGALVGVRWLYRAVVVAVPVFTASLLVASAVQLRIQQREIEDGMRKQIGLWLFDHRRSPNDTVFLEPLGYIGYYSGLKMLDYPGICSPQVVAVYKKLGARASTARVIAELRPDWLVLRPGRGGADSIQSELLRDKYDCVEVFDASTRLKSYAIIPGSGYLNRDRTFCVFRKRGLGPITPREEAVNHGGKP